MKLEIRCASMVANKATILLDGHDISRGVNRLELDMSMDNVNYAVLSLRPTEIEVDVDALLALKAEADLR